MDVQRLQEQYDFSLNVQIERHIISSDKLRPDGSRLLGADVYSEPVFTPAGREIRLCGIPHL